MDQAQESLQAADRGEFMRIDPSLIKVEAGGLWRDSQQQDLETLKASIVWRERRMKGSGLLVPLLVSKIEGVPYFQLEDGFRRFKAVQALLAEGVPMESIPVRVLPAPLTMSERLMLMTHGPKPLCVLDEAKIIVRLEKQGLSFEAMGRLMKRPVDQLKKLAIFGKLTGPLAKALAEGTLRADEALMLINADEEVALQQAKLGKEFKHLLGSAGGKTSKKKEPLGEALGKKDSRAMPLNAKTSWVPKSLDPALYFIALEGLYEWMGAENATKRGYSKSVVEVVKLMLKYCGGKVGLQEIAEKLRNIK